MLSKISSVAHIFDWQTNKEYIDMFYAFTINVDDSKLIQSNSFHMRALAVKFF